MLIMNREGQISPCLLVVEMLCEEIRQEKVKPTNL